MDPALRVFAEPVGTVNREGRNIRDAVLVGTGLLMALYELILTPPPFDQGVSYFVLGLIFGPAFLRRDEARRDKKNGNGNGAK